MIRYCNEKGDRCDNIEKKFNEIIICSLSLMSIIVNKCSLKGMKKTKDVLLAFKSMTRIILYINSDYSSMRSYQRIKIKDYSS